MQVIGDTWALLLCGHRPTSQRNSAALGFCPGDGWLGAKRLGITKNLEHFTKEPCSQQPSLRATSQ